METLIKMIVLWYDVIELIVEGFDHEFDDEKNFCNFWIKYIILKRTQEFWINNMIRIW